MLQTAHPEEHNAAREHMEVPWPPVIKPPTLRAVPMSRSAVRARTHPAHPAHASASWALRLWLGIYMALNLGDLATTYAGIQSGLHEGNPLMRALLMEHGFGSLIVYKVLVVAAVVAGIYMLRRRYPHLAGITLAICNVLVGLAVLLNLTQYMML
jgi:hypothetical protein